MIWFIVAIILLFVEILTVTFGVVCFSIGALIAGILSFFTDSLIWQLTAFSVSSLIAFIFLRPFLKKLVDRSIKHTPTNTEALIGRRAIVSETIDYNKNTGRISIDGDDWKAISVDNSIIEKGNHVTILKVESVILTVKQE